MITTVTTETYLRKPFEVEAVQVTADNIEEIAVWCQGEIEVDTAPFIRVRVARALNDRQRKAYVGDWLLFAGAGFKVYTNKAFKKTFDRATGETMNTPENPNQSNDLPDRAEEKRVDVPQNEESVETPPVETAVTERTTETTVEETPVNLGGGEE
jgi:hypothetical protein